MKRITPVALQAPPRPPGASQRVCGGPPVTAIFFEASPAQRIRYWRYPVTKRDNLRPPYLARAATEASRGGPIHNRFRPSERAVTAIIRPSGESLNIEITDCCGGGTWKRVLGCCRGISRKCTKDNAASAIRSTAVAAIHGNAARGGSGAESAVAGAVWISRISKARVARHFEGAMICLSSSIAAHMFAQFLWCGSGQAVPVRLGFYHCGQNIRYVFAVKHLLPRKHFVQDAAEGPDVSALVNHFSSRLLGTHVSGRTDNDSRQRLRATYRRRIRSSSAPPGRFR